MYPVGKTVLRLASAFLLTGASLPSIAQSPVSCQQLDGAQVFGDEATSYKYLGFFGGSSATAGDSIMFPGGTYGDDSNLVDSVRGNGRFGTAMECGDELIILSSQCEVEVLLNGRPSPIYASNDPAATLPPVIVKDGQILSRLTTNGSITPGVSLDWIGTNCTGASAFSSNVANGEAVPPPVSVDASDQIFSSDTSESGGMFVRWSNSNPGLPAATGVLIQVSDTSEGPRTTVESANIKDLSIVTGGGSAVILGFVPGQEYIVWVLVNNAAGAAQLTGSDPGIPQYVTAGDPDPVSNIVATPGPERLSFDFDPPDDDGGKPILRYEYALEEGSDNRACPKTVALNQAADTADSVVTPPVIIDGLTGGQTYTFCAVACNIDNCGRVALNGLATATAGQPASPPDAPTIDRIEFEDGVILVYFTPGADNGSPVTLFSADCGEGVAGSGTDSPLSVTGASEGETYACSISATNAAGSGSASATAQVTAEVVSTGLFLPLLIEALNQEN